MRKEPFAVGDYVHVYNRGNRKLPIVHDLRDKWHFLQMLYYFNNRITPDNPFRSLRELLKSDFNKRLVWPKEWPTRNPLVKIIAFTLVENHFHLLLKEIVEGGITMFMRKLGTGMTNYFNTKYRESGRLFQGAYKAKRIDDDLYLRYLSVYIQVKNLFEIYPGGFKKAIKEFDDAFDWAINYPYSSLGDYMGEERYPILDKDILEEIIEDKKEYKNFIKKSIFNVDLEEKINDIIF